MKLGNKTKTYRSYQRRTRTAAPTAKQPSPQPSVIEVETERQVPTSQPAVTLPDPPQGEAGMVVILFASLYVVTMWNQFTKPFIDTLWNAKPLKLGGDPRLALGGLLVLLIVYILASISKSMAGLLLIMAIGMWIVYLVMTGGSAIKSLQSYTNPQATGGGHSTVR